MKVDKPWGFYEVLNKSEGFQVKTLFVKSGHKLSLQKHKYRQENWVVAKGVATVTVNNETFDLSKNKSVFIPIGAIHRLENNSDEDLLIIEVQTGDYLEEDDIIRIEDNYGRESEIILNL